MRSARDASFLIFLLFVFVFATCAESQTLSTSQLVVRCASGSRLSTATETILFKRCSDGQLLISSSAGAFAGLATVSSVAFSGPAHMSVTGSPITSSGTISLAWQSQDPNTFLTAPNGSAGAPTFRVIAANDIPASLNGTTFTAGIIGTTIAISGKLQTGHTAAAISTAPAAEFLGAKLSTSSQVIAAIDSTAMAAGVGGGISFAGQYTTAGAVRHFSGIHASKDNATDANSAAGITFTVNNNAATTVVGMHLGSNRWLGVGTTTPGVLTSPMTGTYAGSSRGKHVFSSGVGALLVEADTPVLDLIDVGGTANQEWFRLQWAADTLSFFARNQSGTTRATGATWTGATNTWAFTNITVSGTCTGCSGTGDQNNVGAFASRPAGAVNAGNTYHYTDAPMMQIDDGATLVYFGPRYRFYLPVLGDFAWVNQGTATADQTNGAVWMQGPGTGTGTLRALMKTAPATPYTITIAVQPQFLADIQYAGFAWRDSATDKFVTCYLVQQAGFQGHYAANWTTSSSFSADIAATTEPDSVYNTNRAGVNWIKAVDDGTNRKCSWSVDGVHFYEWYSAGRTTHMTANQIGFTVGNQTSGSTVQMNLYSWLQQ